MRLEAKDLSFRYHKGNRQILNHVSVSLDSSDRLGLAAPSGFGKTTFCKILAGYEQPDEGQVLLDGKPLSEYKGYCPVQLIWQHPQEAVNPRRKMKTVLEEGGVLDERLIHGLGIEKEWMERYPGELSGGQRQRVALARAIVGKPSILLMDEPLSALDAELKIDMRREIQNIHKLTGATILYVTHDQSEALAMADRIIIMKDGAVEQIGTPREIYRDPQTVFAATFVSRCNLLKGSWCGDSFHVKDENILLRNPMIPMEFRNKGLYPIRPEQLTIQPEGNGIQGIIVNKQYNGREIHYSVQYRDEVLTIYAGCQAEDNPGDHISFTLSA